MEKMFKINDREYEIIKDVRDAFNIEELKNKYTEYFDDFDYIVGDWAYSKLRLKGFYNDNNKKVTDINNIKNVDDYLKNYCAFNCKYFIIKKVYKK